MGKLSELRKKHNFTQGELAQKIGVDRRTYQRYEKNDVIANIDALKRAAGVLGVTIEYLSEIDSIDRNKNRGAIMAELDKNNFLDRRISTNLYVKSRIEFICETIAKPYLGQDEERYMRLLEKDHPRFRIGEVMVGDSMARSFLKYVKTKKVKEENKRHLVAALLVGTLQGEQGMKKYENMFDIPLLIKICLQTKKVVLSDYIQNIGEDMDRDWII